MKCTIIFGSPRKEGNTKKLLDIVINEFNEHNVQFELFNAYDSKIDGCRACLGCQSNVKGVCEGEKGLDDNNTADNSLTNEIGCVINDDMQPILKSVASSDMLIIAAPVYIWSLPAPAKAVLDRLVYSGCKQYGNNPDGPYLFEGKKLALVTTCGYPVEKGADLLEEEIIRYCKHTKMEYVGMLCERQRNLKEEFMDDAKEVNAKRFANQILFQLK